MQAFVLLVLEFTRLASASTLWPQGIVHYAINKKDYDIHSQDVILATFQRIQQEVCLKFFNSPGNYSASPSTKILYISNPDKMKDCPPRRYSFQGSIVDMPIGYRCLDQKNISRIVVDMLRASVEQTVSEINSFDLTIRSKDLADLDPRTTLLTAEDRNYLNSHYYRECGSLTLTDGRRSASASVQESSQLSQENLEFYRPLLWPLGVVMYAVHPDIAADDPSLLRVQHAMTTIELSSCVVFQPLPPQDQLTTRNFIFFSHDGEDLPALGFVEGNQTVKLISSATGAPGHAAHALHALLRALGVPMMSNRHDRDHYVRVNWKNVMPGREQYLERAPAAAWLKQIPYDIASATHAPANYMCAACDRPLEALTVLPLQDHLWQNTLSMGRRTDLSGSDKRTLAILYGKECYVRALHDRK